MASLIDILNIDRRSLLQLDGTNPLINYKSYKAKGIEFIVSDPGQLLIHLLQLKAIEFIGKSPETLFPEEKITKSDSLTQRRRKIYCENYENKILSNRLSKTAKEAQAHIEEKGVNVLFLSIGMFKWSESAVSDKCWRSPLLLIPVEMNKTKRLDEEGNDIYELVYNEDEIEDNHSLLEALKDRHQINFPKMPKWAELENEFEIKENFSKWIASIQKEIKNRKDWELQYTQNTLSFFAFTKFYMYKDLDPTKWFKGNDNEGLDLFRKIVDQGFSNEKSLYNEDYNLDENLDPDIPIAVLDLDSSQAKVILEVQNGQSLVVEGPPGTGKSQTIANLLADAVYQGKKVLFVAEKMVALEVVKRRLEEIGLGAICLELHGSKAKKSQFVKNLKETIANPLQAKLQAPFKINVLTQNRDELRNWSNAVNNRLYNGYSPYELMGLLLWIKSELENIALPEKSLATPEKWEEFKSYGNSLTKDSIGDRHQMGKETSSIFILENLLKDIGVPKENPFYGCNLETIPLQSKEQELKNLLNEFKDAIQGVNKTLEEFEITFEIKFYKSIWEAEKLSETILMCLEMPHPILNRKLNFTWEKDKGILESIIKQIKSIQELKKSLLDFIADENYFKTDISETRKILASVKDNLWNRLFNSELKKARKLVIGLLKSTAISKRVSLLSICDKLLELQNNITDLRGHSQVGISYFNELWEHEKTDYELLNHCLTWALKYKALLGIGTINNQLPLLCVNKVPNERMKKCKTELDTIISSVKAKLSELQNNVALSANELENIKHLEFNVLIDRVHSMSDNFQDFAKWILFNNHCNQLKEDRKSLFVEIAIKWPGASFFITRYYQLLVWEQMLEMGFEERPILKLVNGHTLYESCKTFREIDHQLKNFYKAELINKHTTSIGELGSAGQAGYLRSNVQRQRKIPSIRKFLSESFQAIASIKPIFMMSPLSVASYLEALPEMFDLIVFDEASQVEPVDAYGALIRGKQVVVVGDTKQMPPTNFFKKMSGDDDDADEDPTENLATSVNSIMEIMLAKNARSKILQWHYRSKHQSLITVSNKNFYEDKLLIYPSTRVPGEMLGLKIHINDYKTHPYELKGINSKEAEMVARAVLSFAETHSDKSLGVVAFNINQADLIDRKIKELAVLNPKLSEFVNRARLEPFFVKNLERVQGDERDVIFISIGYGKTVQGIFGHQLGPLTKLGGEKRLNVLITRAKLANHIFCNFSSDEIDLTRTASFGVKVLKDYLHYAEKGSLQNEELTGLEADSEFEIQVANELRKLNYDVVHQVGSLGYRIDLAVKHPEKKGIFVMGIECDGATYHSSKSARDRDRLRQSVLESFGWSIYRIWSTDWFYNKSVVLTKLNTALQNAIVAIQDENKPGGLTLNDNNNNEIILNPIEIDSKKSFTPYKFVDTSGWGRHIHIFNIPESVIQNYILQIVKSESPIHIDQVCKRIVEYQGTTLGSRIKGHIEYYIQSLKNSKQIISEHRFLWWNSKKIDKARDYSYYPKKDIEYIAPEELQLALISVIKESISIEKDELIVETARRLGFKATTGVNLALNTVIRQMIKSNIIEITNDLIKSKF
jgi:very-short-patch-repair endonuclease